jgi:hypothetical protein
MQPYLPQTTKVIACATVIEEMLPLMPESLSYEVLDFGLHLSSENLKETLQYKVDKLSSEYETILLGYGLCSMAVVGLVSKNCTLVIPKVDDCIAIFLGSNQSYKSQVMEEPGTYYLTKGWIEVSDTIMDEYNRSVERYGLKKADFIMKEILKHYKRLVYIDTGTSNQKKFQTYAKKAAAQFNLEYEEVPGSNSLIRKMLQGPWDDDFVVVPPGKIITFSDFK